jgi:hypothetical protein
MNSVLQIAAVSSLMSATSSDFTDPSSPFFWILVLLGCAIVGGAIYAIVKAKNSTSTPDNIATTLDQQLSIFQAKFSKEFKDRKSLATAIREQAVTDREACLINFQPLTVVHPGFLGPVNNGVYDEREGVMTALRMGSRCFVLPIDYHDRETLPAAFPAPNTPCLLYRDAGDTIRSINGGSIAKVAQAIADGAWSDVVNQRNDPFILILYFVRTPKENTKESLDFMSQVANDLAPLSPYLLGQTPEGVYNRQARQNQLLFVNVTNLEKKLLVFSNVDTSGFRTSQTDFKHTYLPKEDLDYWVHLRLYKQNRETVVGATNIPEQGGMVRGLIDTPAYYTTMPEDAPSQRAAVNGTKEKFWITLSPAGTNPEATTVTKCLDTYGVQAMPLLLVDYTADVQALMAKWKYAWRAKPKAIRYVRPEPQIIPPQSVRANANGGALTTPS